MSKSENKNNLIDYPGLDWSNCLLLASDAREAAIDILTLFSNSLPKEQAALVQAYEAKDYPLLKNYAHRLYGALSYCDLPRIKNVTAQLELACLLRDVPLVEKHYNDLMKEIDDFLAYCKTCK